MAKMNERLGKAFFKHPLDRSNKLKKKTQEEIDKNIS